MGKNMTGGDAYSGLPTDVAKLLTKDKDDDTGESQLSDQAHAAASTIPGDEHALLGIYQNPCSS